MGNKQRCCDARENMNQVKKGHKKEHDLRKNYEIREFTVNIRLQQIKTKSL